MNSHKGAWLYAAFEPAEARRLARKLEFHYIPKHGNGVKTAEIEIRVFERQGLSRGIRDEASPKWEGAALEAELNARSATVLWQFSCEKACAKLHRLYPDLSNLQGLSTSIAGPLQGSLFGKKSFLR